MACCNVCPSGLEMIVASLKIDYLINARFETIVETCPWIIPDAVNAHADDCLASIHNIVVTHTVIHPKPEGQALQQAMAPPWYMPQRVNPTHSAHQRQHCIDLKNSDIRPERSFWRDVDADF